MRTAGGKADQPNTKNLVRFYGCKSNIYKGKKEVAAAEEKKMFLLNETAQTPTDVLNFKWTAQRVEDAANLEAMPI